MRSSNSCFALCLAVACVLWCASGVWAWEVSPATAVQAAQGWLNLDDSPLDSPASSTLTLQAQSFSDGNGNTLYHVVSLAGAGLVVVAGDDRLEPIIAWLPQAVDFEPSEKNPLYLLLERDLRGRLAWAEAQYSRSAPSPNPRWEKLLAAASGGASRRLTELSDVRVAPFVVSKWDQKNEGSQACYNYYTPPYPAASPGNYYCGCVATAMAQIMRYFSFPTTAVGTPSFTISVDGTPQERSLRGGNGGGGAYDWENMPLDPNSSTPDIARQAIGALTHDAGVAAKMSYTVNWSSASLWNAYLAFRNTFGYANAVCDYDNDNFSGIMAHIVNSNLDARLPLMFAIGYTTGEDGHAVVPDGYGYQDETMYHHINMGWGGYYDAWYNLPIVDSYYYYDALDGIIYNIYTQGSGEIISGRVLDESGLPLADVQINAVSGEDSYSAETDEGGIYALTGLPSNSSYNITAAKEGYDFTGQTQSTGLSNSSGTGNVWGVDFLGTVAESQEDTDILSIMLPVLSAINRTKQ